MHIIALRFGIYQIVEFVNMDDISESLTVLIKYSLPTHYRPFIGLNPIVAVKYWFT